MHTLAFIDWLKSFVVVNVNKSPVFQAKTLSISFRTKWNSFRTTVIFLLNSKLHVILPLAKEHSEPEPINGIIYFY